MNERIREIAEKAGVKYFGDKAVIADKGISGLATEFIPTFSELLIVECIKASIEAIKNNNIGDREDCIIVGNSIADYFGMK